MVLKTGEITKDDLLWDSHGNLGWALVAPYLVLEVARLRVIGMDGFSEEYRVFANFMMVEDPLGPDSAVVDIEHYGSYIRLPKKLYFAGDRGTWANVNKTVAYIRSVNINRIRVNSQ